MRPHDASPARRIAAWIGGAVLGLVLLVAAWGKGLDPAAFAEQIEFEGLDILLSAPLVARLVVALEVGLGLALVLGLRTRGVLITTGALVVTFVFLTGRAYWRWLSGMEVSGPDCGCFGNLVSRTPAEAFWQDLALLVPGYCLSWLAVVGAQARSSLRLWTVLAATAVAGVVTWLSPRLPLDDLATRLRPGSEIAALCAGAGSRSQSQTACLDLVLPELLAGRHLVVMADLASAEAVEAVPGLDALAAAGDPRVWMISDAPGEEQQRFFWEHGPLFEMREVPTALLRPLYRELPRSFAVVDGRVTGTWQGVPQGDEALSEYDH